MILLLIEEYSLLVPIPNSNEFSKGIKEYERHEKRDAMYKIATFLLDHFWGQPSDMADSLGVLLLTWNQSFYRFGFFDFDSLEKCIANNLQEIELFRNKDIFDLSNTDEMKIMDLFNKFLEATRINSIRFSDKNTGKYVLFNLKKILNELDIKFNADNLKSFYESIKYSKIKNALDFVKDVRKDSIEITINDLDILEKDKLLSLDRKMKIIRRSSVSVSKALHLLAPEFFPLWDEKIARAYGCYYAINPAQKYISFCKITKNIAEKVKDYKIRSDRTIIKLIDQYNFSKYTKNWI
jgi:hypothetical protein